MSFVLSIGKWGGFYLTKSKFSGRICLGFVALTILFDDIDDILTEWIWFKKATQLLMEDEK